MVKAEQQPQQQQQHSQKGWERDTRRSSAGRGGGNDGRGDWGGSDSRRRRGDVDSDMARRAVQYWQAAGAPAGDEKNLRRTLRRRALLAALGMLFQTALDLAAAWGGFTLAAFLSIANSVPHHKALSFVATFIGSYYLAGAVCDSFTFFAILFTALRFKVDSSALMQTTKANAGESGLDVVNKANQAIAAAKAHSALGNVSDMLQDEGGNVEGLSNYLSAKHAQERRRAQLGGSDYTTVSDLFYQGVNGNGLDFGQVQELIDELNIGRNRGVSEPRLQEAFDRADTDHDGVIDLGQFVSLYQTVY